MLKINKNFQPVNNTTATDELLIQMFGKAIAARMKAEAEAWAATNKKQVYYAKD